MTRDRKTPTNPRGSDRGMTLLRWLIALLVIFVVTRVDAAQPPLELTNTLTQRVEGLDCTR